MVTNARRHYIDNLRWMMVLILIPYHTAQAWNVWGEPNYIFFNENRWISSSLVFFSPYFMPILFILAGISTKLALDKRSEKEYILERIKRLLVPLVFGTVTLMPIITYLADCFYGTYNGSFLRHYAVFFTRYTDLIGADGGFSFGQFCFILYLFLISLFSLGLIKLLQKTSFNLNKTIPLPVILLLGLPVPLFHEIINIGGKSFGEYTYFFIAGYFIFSNEENIASLEKNRWWLLLMGLISTILYVYLIVWTDRSLQFLNTAMNYVSKWTMVIALLGLSKKYLNFSGKISNYMSKRSILFYFYHFVWVVAFQYILYKLIGNNTWLIYSLTLLLSYTATFLCCEITIRIPVLCFLTGIKYKYQHTK